ncbi:glycosyltransferase family 39 protein [Streptacidiphilus sp. EB129]|uniref:glycosyltransferase family 39 protein n=1 Tax=Streptacidiphilus sp. EB129 TaxID=3156262 RepID=UPI003515C530
MLVLGLVGVGDRQPWQDEYATWWAATLSWSDFGRLLSHVDIVLAPYYTLMHLWIGVFGDSAAAMRIPSVLAMSAAAGVVALLGRRLFDRSVGLAGGLLFAVIPMTTRYAQEARPYAFAVLAAASATLLLLRVLDRSSVGRWASYGTLVTCMGLAHLVTLTVLAAHLVAVLSTARPARGRSLPAWLLTVVVALLPVLPLAYLGHTQSQQIAWLQQQSASLVQLPGQVFHSGTAAGVMIGASVLGLLLTRRWAAMLLCWALLPPVLLFATKNVLDLFLNRYLIFTLPAWALLAAAALCAVVRLLPGGGKAWHQPVAAALAASALLLGTTADITSLRADPLPGEPDWRAATAWMLQHDQPGDGMAFNGYREGRLALSYQLRRVQNAPQDVFLGRSAQSLGLFDPQNSADPAAAAARVNRIWLLSTAPKGHSFDQMPTSIGALFATRYRVVQTTNFSSVRVLLLVPTTAG